MLSKVLNVDPSKRFSIQEIYEHPWCRQITEIPLNSGIMVGYHRMPIDSNILNQLSEYNFDLEYSSRCIEANKHNHITTTYYLLLKKHLKGGSQSNADLSSPNFDYNAVEPFKRVEAKPKYQFFSSQSDKNPIIDLDTNDIQIGKKNDKSIFNIKPSSSKNKDKPIVYSNEHRKSNHGFMGQERKVENGSNKQFHDLRMYLKPPRKKEYFSEAKRKKEEKHRTHSVYY